MYTDRYAQGLSNSSTTTGNAKIVYKYHEHTDSCYSAPVTCNVHEKSDFVNEDSPGVSVYHHVVTHSACGQHRDEYLSNIGPADLYYTHTFRKLICGKREGEIESATITF